MQADSLNNKQQAATRAASANAGQPPEAAPRQTTFEHQQQQQQQWLPEQKPSVCFDTTVSGQHAGVASRAAAVLAASPTAGGQLQPHQFSLTPAATSGRTASGGEVFMQQQQQQVTLSPRSSSTSSFPVGPGSVWQPYNFPQSVHEQDSASKHLSPQHSMEFGATAAAKMAGPALPVQQQQIQQQQQVQVQQQQQQQLQLPQQHYQQQQQQQQQQPAPNQQATSPVVIPQQGYRSHGPAQVVSGSPGGARSPGGRSPRQPPSRLPSFQRASIKEEFSDDDDDSSDEDDRLSLAASRQSQVMSRRGGSAVGADSFVAPGSHASRPLSPRAASPSGVGLHYTVSAEAASRASQAPSLRAEGSVVEDLGAVASAAASFNVGLEASAAVAAAAQQHPPQQQQQPGAGRGKEGAAVAAAGGSGGGKQEEGDALQQEFQNLALFDDDDDDEDLDAPEKRVWYKRPLVWLHVMAFVLALVLFVVGLCSQFLVTSWQSTSTNESIQLHRWMYFFSLWPLLWVCVVALNNRVFRFVEWLFYREALYYLDSVRRTARNLLFMGLILAWHEIIFRLAWCEDRCSAASSDKAVNRLWKVMLCTFFFTMANFLKAMLTKFMSTHFYRTAHFKKVKQAIEKEYYLMMLSQPRPHKLEPEPLSLNHTASIFGTVLKRRVTGEPGAWGSPSHAGGLGSPSADGRPGHYKSWSLDLTEPSFAQGGLRSLATRSLTMFKAYGGHNSLEMTAAGPEGQRAAHPVRSRSAAQLQTPEARSATLQSAHEGNEVPAAAPPQVPGIGQPPAGGEEQPPWDGAGAPLPGLDVLQPPLVTVQATAEGGPAPGCLWSRRRGHGDHYQQPQQQPSPSTCPSERRGLLRSTSSPWVPSTPPPPGAAGGPAVSTMGLKVIHEGQPSVTSPTGPGSAPSGRSGSFVRPSGGSMTAAATPAAAAAGGGAAAKPSTAASLLKAASGRLRRSSHADEAAANGDKAAAGSGAPPVTRTASGIARKVSGSAGGPGIGMASAAHAGADDPLLQPEVLETVNIRVRGEKVKLSNISTAEWERLRTGIALKTFTALMTRYQAMSEAEEERKLKEARRFAKGLFFNIKEDPDRTFLIRSDFDVFFTSRDMADQAFRYFDKDNDQRLSLREMKDSVVAIFKERKNMASSLKDTDSIVHTLEFGIGCVFHFLFFAVYLLVWNVDIMKGFDTFSATVLALTFVFGNSVRQIYESMLFLFVEHAFDVGDLLEVEGMQYRVKKIDLMYTLMVKSTGEHSYYPNTRLITLPVLNLTRATGRTDKVVFSLDVGRGGAAARAALMAALKKHHEVNGSDFSSCPSVNYVGLLDPFKVQIQVAWTYSFGPDDIKRAASVKTALLSEVHQCLGSLPLEYTYAQHGDEDERHTAGSSPGPGAGAAPAPGAQQGLRPDTGMPFLFGPPAPAAAPPAVAPK